jgi:hypothetical protein
LHLHASAGEKSSDLGYFTSLPGFLIYFNWILPNRFIWFIVIPTYLRQERSLRPQTIQKNMPAHPRQRPGRKGSFIVITLTAAILLSCNIPMAIPTSTSTATRTGTATRTFTAAWTSTFTVTPTSTSAPTETSTPTETLTPTITSTPTITLTPTFDFPDGIVKEQSFCRYGPGKAYLYAASLFAGDKVMIWNRNPTGAWLWVQPETIKYQCWVAASQLTIQGDVFTLWVKSVKLPPSTLYGPVQRVSAKRTADDQVVVTWEPVYRTVDDDRGYLIEANLCQNTTLIWLAVQTDLPTYTFTDQVGCSQASSALLYVVEKHGYTAPIQVPWP